MSPAWILTGTVPRTGPVHFTTWAAERTAVPRLTSVLLERCWTVLCSALNGIFEYFVGRLLIGLWSSTNCKLKNLSRVKISVDVFSSPYLDVSVQAVPSVYLWIQYTVTGLDSGRVSPFGYPRIIACFRLPVAFRRSLRPSSAPSAKASPLRSS